MGPLTVQIQGESQQRDMPAGPNPQGGLQARTEGRDVMNRSIFLSFCCTTDLTQLQGQQPARNIVIQAVGSQAKGKPCALAHPRSCCIDGAGSLTRLSRCSRSG